MFEFVVPGSLRKEVVVHAERFLYKLFGCSQPALIIGSNGDVYVLKFADTFPFLTVNEIMGSFLFSRVGLSVAGWDLVYVSSEFIDANPGIWLDNKRKPTPGLHFGSKLPRLEGEEAELYQMIPRHMIPSIINRHEFLGALAVDLWTNHSDRRQAIFCSDGISSSISAVFIDHGHMFGGDRHDSPPSTRRCMFYDKSCYLDLFQIADIEVWIDRISSIDLSEIRTMLDLIPAKHASESAKSCITEVLASRRRILPSLLAEAKDIAESDLSFQYHGVRLATEPHYRYRPPIHSRPA